MIQARSIPRTLLALGLAALVPGLGPAAAQESPAAAQETIKVGIVLPLTGQQAFFGEMEKESFDLALEEINVDGVRGARLEFVFADDQGRPEVGATAAEKLIDEDGVVMLGGGYSSSVTLKIAEVAEVRGIPFLVNTGAADSITERGHDWVFRLNPPSSGYVASAMSFLTEVVKPRSVAIIHEETAFGESQAEAFQAACRAAGIPVVVHESYTPAEFPLWRITQILLKVKRARPDVVYMVSYVMDASLLMTQARSLAWSPRVYMGGGGGFTLPAFYELTREAADHVFTVTLWDRSLPYPRADVYHAKALARSGLEPDYHGAEAYAAAYVIADALGRAATLAPADLRQALAATRLKTVFGPVEFVSEGGKTNQNRLPTYVGQWINGRLELVWPPEVARRDYVLPAAGR